MTDLRSRVAWLLWCMDRGYLLAEDREILTGPSIFETPDHLLHPDDLETKPGFLSLADDAIDLIRADILEYLCPECLFAVEEGL